MKTSNINDLIAVTPSSIPTTHTISDVDHVVRFLISDTVSKAEFKSITVLIYLSHPSLSNQDNDDFHSAADAEHQRFGIVEVDNDSQFILSDDEDSAVDDDDDDGNVTPSEDSGESFGASLDDTAASDAGANTVEEDDDDDDDDDDIGNNENEDNSFAVSDDESV